MNQFVDGHDGEVGNIDEKVDDRHEGHADDDCQRKISKIRFRNLLRNRAKLINGLSNMASY